MPYGFVLLAEYRDQLESIESTFFNLQITHTTKSEGEGTDVLIYFDAEELVKLEVDSNGVYLPVKGINYYINPVPT